MRWPEHSISNPNISHILVFNDTQSHTGRRRILEASPSCILQIILYFCNGILHSIVFLHITVYCIGILYEWALYKYLCWKKHKPKLLVEDVNCALHVWRPKLNAFVGAELGSLESSHLDQGTGQILHVS